MDNATVPEIPTDLLIEIFSKLPLLSTLKCKAVSKGWNRLISSESFPKSTAAQLAMTHLIYLRSQDDLPAENCCYSTVGLNIDKMDENIPCPSIPLNMRFLPHNPQHFITKLEILDSCNGLILCLIPPKSFFVGNPLNQTWVEIPTPPYTTKKFFFRNYPFPLKTSGHRMFLVFDPKVSNHFRVIFPIVLSRYKLLKMDVFSSELWEWNSIEKEAHIPDFDYVDRKHWCVDFIRPIDGVLYLRSNAMAIRVEIDDHGLITSDIDRFGFISIDNLIDMPHHVKYSSLDYDLREWNGYVQLYETDEREKVIRIWQLQYGRSSTWVEKHIVSYEFLGIKSKPSEAYFQPDKDAFYMITEDNAIVYYECHTGKKRIIKVDDIHLSKQRLHPFSPSSLLDLFALEREMKAAEVRKT